MSEQMDEQARELGQQLCSHVNGQYMDPNGIAMITILLARVRLAEAEWWEHLSPDCDLPENQPCGYCERIASLRQAAGERT